MSESIVKRKLRYILERLDDMTPLYHLTDEEAADIIEDMKTRAVDSLSLYEGRISHPHTCTICGKRPAQYMNVRRCKPCQKLYMKAYRAERKRRHKVWQAERAAQQEREATQ